MGKMVKKIRRHTESAVAGMIYYDSRLSACWLRRTRRQSLALQYKGGDSRSPGGETA